MSGQGAGASKRREETVEPVRKDFGRTWVLKQR
jgi:hypothetical protein